MSTGFRVQGAPSTIQSNVVGAGLIEGDQIGDQLPGVLASLQESPEASKTSSLYYNETVGVFNQPSYQRAMGALNLPVPITKFGDSGSIEVNPDMYWKGPCMLSTTFIIPYAYYGPVIYRPPEKDYITDSALNTYGDISYGGSGSFYNQSAGSVTVRPRLFYSWGAAYANLRQIRMNMGGAMSYVLDHYSNFVGVMASCVSLIQRAALMRAAGSGVMIPDRVNETRFGLTHETAEIGSIPLFSADGGLLSATNAIASYQAYGQGGSSKQTGPASVAGPLIEHWLAVVKTPHTNFASMHQMRRPIDTRLFSSNFVIDYFTNNAMDTFMDTGTGWQPVVSRIATSSTDVPPANYAGYYIPNNAVSKIYKAQDGLFPCMLYRQLQIQNYSTLVGTADGADRTVFALTNADVTPLNSTPGVGVAGSLAQDYRVSQYTSYKTIATSPGYLSAYGNGSSPLNGPPTGFLSPDNLPTPQYNTVISSLRLANDQLGAKKVLETRPDLCVLYPFQHFTSQTYRVSQTTTVNGIIPYNPLSQLTAGQLTPFVNTAAGGSGFGGLSEINCKTYGAAPASYTNPLFVAVSIPNNPLTCLYIMVMREKDRVGLGYSTSNQYSPVLYWNALELQAFSLTYSAQVLQDYNSMDEYLIPQLHERVEPLIVPYRGGPVCRRDLPLNSPQDIQDGCGYPGVWYNSYIYELCMVDQIPLKNEAFMQQTPSFRGELLNFNFNIKPSLRPWCASDYDFRSVTGLDTGLTIDATFSPTANSAAWYTYMERLAAWCPGIPQSAVGETPCMNWNLNNDNLMVVCVFAQNALWQLNPLSSKIIFARGA